MSLHDLYVISPYLSVAGIAILVILLDLAIPKKGLLPAAAVLGLLAPLALSLLQLRDLSVSTQLLAEGSVLVGTLSVDRFALFFNFLVLASTGLVIIASSEYVGKMDRFRGEYFGLILFSATGMMLLAAATELITIYISLELITLPLAALAAFLMTARSTEAGMKFLIVGAMSSALMLYGMALIFGFTGSTTLEGIAEGIAAAAASPAQPDLAFGSYAVLLGLVLMLAGFGFKISAVPFQMWAPDIYEGAPTPVVAFLSVASKAAGFAILLRVLFTGFFDVSLEWGGLIAILAAASMTVGNLAAIGQGDIKRLLGYSAIAQAGYILVGVAAGIKGSGLGLDLPEYAPIGPSSVVFYLASYAAANLTAFFAIIAISNRVGSDRIDDYAGVARRSPFLATALALGLIALIGVPPTSIFIAKLYIFTAAVNSGLAWLAILGVINSVVSAYYYIRVIRVMFLQPPSAPEDGGHIKAPISSWFAVSLAGAALLWMGIAPGFILKLAELASVPLAP
jgi:NADH-quinone oxidoreductase subunit N